MFLRCENPDCAYETGDCPSTTKKCLIWLKRKIIRAGGKCNINASGELVGFECPQCNGTEFSID